MGYRSTAADRARPHDHAYASRGAAGSSGKKVWFRQVLSASYAGVAAGSFPWFAGDQLRKVVRRHADHRTGQSRGICHLRGQSVRVTRGTIRWRGARAVFALYGYVRHLLELVFRHGGVAGVRYANDVHQGREGVRHRQAVRQTAVALGAEGLDRRRYDLAELPASWTPGISQSTEGSIPKSDGRRRTGASGRTL